MAKNKKNKDVEKRSKKRFEVGQGETIDSCLERISKEGYTPVRKTEEPIFKEINNNGQITYEPVSRKVVFDAVLAKPEH